MTLARCLSRELRVSGLRSFWASGYIRPSGPTRPYQRRWSGSEKATVPWPCSRRLRPKTRRARTAAPPAPTASKRSHRQRPQRRLPHPRSARIRKGATQGRAVAGEAGMVFLLRVLLQRFLRPTSQTSLCPSRPPSKCSTGAALRESDRSCRSLSFLVYARFLLGSSLRGVRFGVRLSELPLPSEGAQHTNASLPADSLAEKAAQI